MTEPTTDPMTDGDRPRNEDALAGQTLELIVRVGLGLGLLVFCAYILAPFFHAVLWAVLLAVALHTPFGALTRAVGGRTHAAAVLFALIGLAGILVPAVLLSAGVFEAAQRLAAQFAADTVDIPPPPDSVAQWPVIGEKVHAFWGSVSTNAADALQPLAPQLKEVGVWLLSMVGSLGGAVLQILVAILIAAPLLARAESGGRLTRRLANRLVGRRGDEFAGIATVTVRGVARGIIGVAVIQSTLAGIGFAVGGIPGAPAWALVCLALAIVQIGPSPVLLGTIIYMFTNEPTMTAVIYTAWAGLVGLSDNVLRPFLYGNKIETPALVLMIGSIGGLLTSGVIGLFTGAVILALGYELVRVWLTDRAKADGAGEAETEAPAPADDAPAAPG